MGSHLVGRVLGSRLVIKHFLVRGWSAGLFVVRRYITGLGGTLPPLFQGCVQVGFYCAHPMIFPKLACVSLRWNEIRIGRPAAVERGPS